jgi:hypothetical protein
LSLRRLVIFPPFNAQLSLLLARIPNERQFSVWLPITLLPLTQGCAIVAHDAAFDHYRLQENLKPAEALVQQLARSDLACGRIQTRELSSKIAEGAPLGPVWRDYTIQASGCGKSATYAIQCEGDHDCMKK